MARPAPRMELPPRNQAPELVDAFAAAERQLGFTPNSFLIMQQRPELLRAFGSVINAAMGPGAVNPGLKGLVAFMTSQSAGCQYCMAHGAAATSREGKAAERFAAIWDYQTSPLFSEAERAALDVAVAGACVPNAVTDEMFAELRKHWSDEQIVEIVGVIAMMGFLNRWNETFATPLEDLPMALGEERLAQSGWTAGKHARS